MLSRLDTEQRETSPDTWISIDVETSGLSPSLVGHPDQAFHVGLQPAPGWPRRATGLRRLQRPVRLDAGSRHETPASRAGPWRTARLTTGHRLRHPGNDV